MARFNIDSSSPLPLYQQLILSIKIEILSGRMSDGDQLPPIRDLAKLLKLNPNTVAKAYYTLEKEGFVESRRGSGNWVKFRKADADSIRRGMIEDDFKAFLDRAFSLGGTKKYINNLVKRYLNDEPDIR